MKFKVMVEYEYPIEHKCPVKAEIILHGDKVISDNIEWLEQEPCEDAVSRQEIYDELEKWEWQELYLPIHFKENIVDVLPPVTPTRQKGKWIMTNDYLTTAYGSVDYVKCSCCGEDSLEEGEFCPNCGADMREGEA